MCLVIFSVVVIFLVGSVMMVRLVCECVSLFSVLVVLLCRNIGGLGLGVVFSVVCSMCVWWVWWVGLLGGLVNMIIEFGMNSGERKWLFMNINFSWC